MSNATKTKRVPKCKKVDRIKVVKVYIIETVHRGEQRILMVTHNEDQSRESYHHLKQTLPPTSQVYLHVVPVKLKSR